MMYLCLAIVSSMLISALMRASESRISNNISMLAVNYVMCTALSLLFTGSAIRLESAQGMPLAMTLGVINGSMYLGSFMLLQWNIRKNGVALPATFMKLGVIVPTVLAIVCFGEAPKATQLVGIVLAIAAILLMQARTKGNKTHSFVGLLLLLAGGGVTDSMAKVYETIGDPALKNHFLLCTFVAATVLCIAVCRVNKQGLTKADALYGLLIGVPNYFSARFLLYALSSVPAVVAYPTYSVGTIVLVTLCGRFVFGERLTRRQMIAMGVILLALVLLNM